ncbi:sugar phosphate isomerase/epimerase family protein [Saccharomonospora sp. NPDC046836]|uniref:sugar phosphate isomerase/epimerase family protein n=1 Tax=Saccharomonospora sp. NPDC046836 TaxID=3156921 RepID=UPI0033CF28FA
MKWSYPYAGADVPGTVMALRGTPYEALSYLGSLSFDAIELLVRDPRELDRGALDGALAATTMTVSAIGTGPMGMVDGLTLTAADADVRAETVRRLVASVELAAAWGAQVIVGKLRGAVSGHPDALSWQRDGILRILEQADALGVLVTFEPQSVPHVDNLTTTAEAVEFVRGLGGNARVMIDTYHSDISDERPLEAYGIAGVLLSHVHLSDDERKTPGAGRIALGEHLAAIEAAGYPFSLSFEFTQSPDARTAAADAISHMRSLVSSRG